MTPLDVGTSSGTGASGDEKADETSLPTPLGNVTNFSAARQLPTISITKPPAPMPVDLPSPSNLTPEDEVGGAFPLQNDIEGNPIVENASPVPLTAVPPRIVRSRSPSPKLTLETTPGLSESPDTMKPTVLPPPVVPDLLVDDTTLVGPSQSDGAGSSGKSETDSPVLVDAADVSSHQDPDTTIRLVGGGGVSGTTEDPLQAEGVLVEEPHAVDNDAAEVASIKSVDSKASTSSKKHGRKKSSVSISLKKLGQIGGKRRTDSVTSVDLKQ